MRQKVTNNTINNVIYKLVLKENITSLLSTSNSRLITGSWTKLAGNTCEEGTACSSWVNAVCFSGVRVSQSLVSLWHRYSVTVKPSHKLVNIKVIVTEHDP
jgi:hypothetical protein